MGKCACTEGWEGKACECPKSNQTCLDSKGVSRSRNGVLGSDGASRHLSWLVDLSSQGVCNGRGKCVCGLCECPESGIEMTSTCEPNFQVCVCVCVVCEV